MDAVPLYSWGWIDSGAEETAWERPSSGGWAAGRCLASPGLRPVPSGRAPFLVPGRAGTRSALQQRLILFAAVVPHVCTEAVSSVNIHYASSETTYSGDFYRSIIDTNLY